MAKGKSKQQELIEQLLEKSGSKATYNEWRATTLHEAALSLVGGNGGTYADAVLKIATDELKEQVLSDILAKPKTNSFTSPGVTTNSGI